MVVAAPAPAEKARSVLAAALGAEVRWGDPSTEEPLRTTARELVFVGRPPPSRPDPRRTVFVEVADAAPLPVRDRIRARVRVIGQAEDELPTEPGVLHIRPAVVLLDEGQVTTPVPLADFLSAEPDPIATTEAGVLSHLENAHHEVVGTLSRLVKPALLQGVVRIWALAVDRHGVVLRLEYPSRHHDVRLAFDAPLDRANQLGAAVAELLVRARERRLPCRRPELHRRP